MRARVDLADPGPEGAALADGLRAAGHDVSPIAIADVPQTDAAALVLAGDAEGALDALRALRDDGAAPDTPVVLLGTPAGTDHRGEGEPGFGAQAVLLRPVSLGQLVSALARVLAPAHDHAPVPQLRPLGEPTLELDRVPPQAAPPAPILAARPESTLQLPDTGTDPLRDAEALPPAASVVPMIAPGWRPERTPSTAAGDSSSGTVQGPTATISDRLRMLLEAADRRVFPGRPPIDLSLPGGDESARELLPAEVLEPDDFALDALALAADDDPIDTFTFVGGPALPSALSADLSSGGEVPAAPRAPGGSEPPPLAGAAPETPAPKTAPGTPTSLSKRPPRGEPTSPPRPPATHVQPGEPQTGVHAARLSPPASPREREWPLEDSVLGRATPDGGRRGSLAEGGALRLLLRATELRLDATLTIVPGASPGVPLADALSLTIVAGELAALETPTSRRAALLLRRRGAAVGPGDDEASAGRALEEALERGAITRYERARAEREARLECVRDVVASARGTFSIARLEPSQLPRPAPSPLGMPLRIALFEAARRALHGERARAVLGGPAVTLRRGPRWEALVAEGLVSPEIAELITEHEDASAEWLARAAPDEPGLLGLFCALVAAGALTAHAGAPAEPSLEEQRRHARRLVEEAAGIAEDADYFTILGVDPDASDRDVEQAHRRRREQLEALPLDELDLGALVALRRTALESLDEAHRVLAVPRWRETYARALAHGPALAVPAAEH